MKLNFVRTLLICMFCGPANMSAQAASRPNVLLIAIDDLNDWVGCLEGHPQAETPNIDALAARSLLFTNAHCQAPICNPSRTSFMLGLRPSTTGVYENAPSFRSVQSLTNRVTLGQHFGDHGYQTLTTGKIFHGSAKDASSFQTWGPTPGQTSTQDARVVEESKGIWDFGPQLYPEHEFADHITADWAMEQLKSLTTTEKPFLMAIGFYRPHVPMYAPQRFFDARPRDLVQLPQTLADDRMDLPQAAIDLVANDVPPTHDWFVNSDQWTDAVRAYQSCVSFTDVQVGRLLKALEDSPHADSTIVVLFSDHGFHLGEKQMWAKRSLWERSTRVPLIFLVPGKSTPQQCSQAVELLALYPTLCELCSIPAPHDLDGISIVPLIDNPQQTWNHPAITTFEQNNHAIRDQQYRYIRYADGSEELYDLHADPQEWTNLAARPDHSATIARLQQFIPKTNVVEAKADINADIGKKRRANAR